MKEGNAYDVVCTFLIKLREIASRSLCESSEKCDVNSLCAHAVTTPVRGLVRELDAVGWDRIANISSDMRRIEIRCTDLGKRVHSLVVQLSSDHPKLRPR